MSVGSVDALFVRTLGHADPLRAASAVRQACHDEMHAGEGDSNARAASEAAVWSLVELLMADRIDRSKGSSHLPMPSISHGGGAGVMMERSGSGLREAVLVRHWLEVGASLFFFPSSSSASFPSSMLLNASSVSFGVPSDELERMASAVMYYLRRGRHDAAYQYCCECNAPALGTLLPVPLCLPKNKHLELLNSKIKQQPSQLSSSSSPLSSSRPLISATARLERTHTTPTSASAAAAANQRHIPNASQPSSSSSNSASVWSGNSRRALVRSIASVASGSSVLQSFPHLSAWYGLLGHNLEAILPVCPSWHDQLWAYLFIITADSDRAASANQLMVEALNTLSTSSNDRVRREAHDFMWTAVKLLILGTAPAMTHLLTLLRDAPAHHIRFAAHLGIFLTRCQLWDTSSWLDAVSHVISRYVDQLIQEKQYDIIASYAAQIPSEDLQVEVYIRFLTSSARDSDKSNNHRDFYLQLAEKAGLNVRRIASQLVDSIIQHPDSVAPVQKSVHDSNAPTVPLLRIPESGSVWESLSPADQARIQSLEWMAYSARSSAAARAEIFTFVNALAKAYILDSNVTALAAVFEQIDSLLPTLLGDVRADMSADPANASVTNLLLRDHICLRQYSELQLAYSEWYSLWQSKPPVPLAPSPDELRQHFSSVRYKEQLRQFDREMESWMASANDSSSRVVTAARELVCFPGGWLSDSGDQVQELRAKCIPEAFSHWHRVLFENKDYGAALNLSTIIAVSRWTMPRL
eukprot:TRINITY_DN1030_c0_g1_i1.p1 TRINITY_DN1030_c0_g1~~TRINITY_DN1030_c0_g1_i1.p1  ORF type:complete len:753 (+),score=99.81 TRINITY_DN1030_c0_g1_i1:787-3045(+)